MLKIHTKKSLSIVKFPNCLRDFIKITTKKFLVKTIFFIMVFTIC